MVKWKMNVIAILDVFSLLPYMKYIKNKIGYLEV